jgi:hypothetical protein
VADILSNGPLDISSPLSYVPPPESDAMQSNFDRNQIWTVPGAATFNTDLGEKEQEFQRWVTANKVPFDPNVNGPQDYDMRGFWAALMAGDPRASSAIDPNDQRLHYPDYWKTPYHETFSNESQWATPNAPQWNDKDQLVAPDGTILFDDLARTQ